jgi:translation initiation factor 2B subunit (eIF-2B alpha/beta/delta family)
MITETVALRDRSDELSKMIVAGSKALSENAAHMVRIIEGSATGQEAVQAMSAAAAALNQAATSMISMKNTCDNCIAELKR